MADSQTTLLIRGAQLDELIERHLMGDAEYTDAECAVLLHAEHMRIAALEDRLVERHVFGDKSL